MTRRSPGPGGRRLQTVTLGGDRQRLARCRVRRGRATYSSSGSPAAGQAAVPSGRPRWSPTCRVRPWTGVMRPGHGVDTVLRLDTPFERSLRKREPAAAVEQWPTDRAPPIMARHTAGRKDARRANPPWTVPVSWTRMSLSVAWEAVDDPRPECSAPDRLRGPLSAA